MTDWLVDKSALVRIGSSPDVETWAARAERGMLRISTPTLLEHGYSARSGTDWQTIVRGTPVAWFPIEYVTPRAEQRALEVQSILAERGQHRAASIPDLIVAAIAEISSLVVLHVDKDFELIADVTGQPLERLRA